MADNPLIADATKPVDQAKNDQPEEEAKKRHPFLYGILVGITGVLGLLLLVLQVTGELRKLTNGLSEEKGTSGEKNVLGSSSELRVPIDKVLKRYLGQEKGHIVYEALIRKIQDPAAFFAYRGSMQYKIRIYDRVPKISSLGQKLKTNNYYYFESQLKFSRHQTLANDEFIVAAVTDSNQLSLWSGKKDVIYREVLSVNPEDKAWVDTVLADAKLAPNAIARAERISRLFQIDFKLFGLHADLIDVRIEPFGISMVYKVPQNIDWKKPVDYEFDVKTVQSKKQNTFPIIVVEATQKLDVTFDFTRAQLRDVRFLSVFYEGPNPTNPVIDFDSNQRVLQIRSIGDEWILPRSGALVYWDN